MRFTQDEFNTMLNELFVEEPARYDTLCAIAMKHLQPIINGWCISFSLSGGEYQFDVMQETLAKLMKTCVTHFFLRDGRTTPNTDIDQFCKWITTVARNVTMDVLKKLGKRSTVDIEPWAESIGSEEPERYLVEDIDAVFDAVIDFNMGVHKLLAWLCVSVVILNEADDRSDATEIVVERLGMATLDEMLEFLLRELRYYPALLPSDNQLARIRASLDEPDELGVRMGDRPFYTFFMAKGGKGSVSDWYHKINQLIRRKQ